MKKTAFGLLLTLILITVSVKVASALPTLPTLPNAAKTASRAIDDNGQLKAPPEFVNQLPESELTKIIFIRYVPGFQKDKPCNNDGICDAGEKGWCGDCKGTEPTPQPTLRTICYDFLAGSKPKWNWVENYYYSSQDLGTSSAWATTTWDDITSAAIFGSGVSGDYPWGVYDYKNSISYGNYDEPGVLAVTAIWFRGKNIYEYDIMFDTDYTWGDATVDPGVFDLDTVTLHEFGHGAGLADLYDTICSDEVMYWQYQGVKRTLRDGDTAGIQELYGN